MIKYIPFLLAIWKFQATFSLSPSVLFFHEKDTQQDLSYYRCLSGQYFMPNEKQLNIILHHRPTAMPPPARTTFSRCRSSFPQFIQLFSSTFRLELCARQCAGKWQSNCLLLGWVRGFDRIFTRANYAKG